MPEPVAQIVPGRRVVLRGLLRDRTAMTGIVSSFILAAALAPLLAPHDPNAVDVLRKFAPLSAEFPLGTDHLGEKPYVEAARATGVSGWRILWRHLLRNIVGPVMVLTTLDMGAILLEISALSFLGLGVKPPTSELGAMLSEGRSYLGQSPNMMLFPGVAIFLMALGFNLFGDGLRDVLDPHTRRSAGP